MKRYICSILFCLTYLVAVNAQRLTMSKADGVNTEGTFLLYNVDFGGYLVGGNDCKTQASLDKKNAWKIRLKKYIPVDDTWDGKTFLIEDSVENGENQGQWLNVFIEKNGQIYTDAINTTAKRDSLWTIVKDRNSGYYTIMPSQLNSTYKSLALQGTVLGITSIQQGRTIPTVDLISINNAKYTRWALLGTKNLEKFAIEKLHGKVVSLSEVAADMGIDEHVITRAKTIAENHSSSEDELYKVLGALRLAIKKQNKVSGNEIDFSDLIIDKFKNVEIIQAKTFDRYQDILGIPDGYYRINASAFCLNTDRDYAWFERDSSVVLSELYANEMSMPLKNVMTEPLDTSVSVNDYWAIDGSAYPGNDASIYTFNDPFTGGRYNNSIYCKVTDGKIRIGIRQNKVRSGCQTVIRELKLTYLGTDENVLLPAFELYEGKVNELNNICNIRSMTCKIDKVLFNDSKSYETLSKINSAVSHTRQMLLAREEDAINNINIGTPESASDKKLANPKAMDLKTEYQKGLVLKTLNPTESRRHMIRAISLLQDFIDHGELPEECGIDNFDNDYTMIQWNILVSALYRTDRMRDSAEYYLNQALKKEREYISGGLGNIEWIYKFNRDSTDIEKEALSYDGDSITYTVNIAICETALAYLDAIGKSDKDNKNLQQGYVEIITQLARSRQCLRDFDGALQEWEKAIGYIKKHDIHDDYFEYFMYNSIYNEYNLNKLIKNDKKKAIKIILENVEYFKNATDYRYPTTLYYILSEEVNNGEAEKFALAGIETSLKANMIWMDHLYVNLIKSELSLKKWDNLVKNLNNWFDLMVATSDPEVLNDMIILTMDSIPEDRLPDLEQLINKIAEKIPKYDLTFTQIQLYVRQNKITKAIELFEQNKTYQKLKYSDAIEEQAHYCYLAANYIGYYLHTGNDEKYQKEANYIKAHITYMVEDDIFLDCLANANLCADNLNKIGDTKSGERLKADIKEFIRLALKINPNILDELRDDESLSDLFKERGLVK